MTICFLISGLVIHYSVFLTTAYGCAIYSVELLSTQSNAAQDVPSGGKLQVLFVSHLWATKCSENFGMSIWYEFTVVQSNTHLYPWCQNMYYALGGNFFLMYLVLLLPVKKLTLWLGKPASKWTCHRVMRAVLCGVQSAEAQIGANAVGTGFTKGWHFNGILKAEQELLRRARSLVFTWCGTDKL